MADAPRKTKATSASRTAKKTTNGKKTAELITMAAPAPAPTHDQIAELARRYWAERGYADGRQEDDWFRAEQELRSKAS